MTTECDIRKNNKTFPSSATTTTTTKRVAWIKCLGSDCSHIKFNYSQVNLLVEPSETKRIV